MKEMKLMASDDTLYDVLNAIRSELKETVCTEQALTQILIAAEEIFVNIAHYAYGGKPGEVRVVMDYNPDTHMFRMVFRDRGTPYNPLAKEDPDITLPGRDRAIGGLGIYMVKEFMDHETYEYEDGQNVFIMEKDVTSE